MTKNTLNKVNFSLLTIAMISLGIFLWLSDNYKDNFILWILIPLVLISYAYTTYVFLKEKNEVSDEIITLNMIVDGLKKTWKTNKSTIWNLLFQLTLFVILVFIYNYGLLIIPMFIYTITNFIYSLVKKEKVVI